MTQGRKALVIADAGLVEVPGVSPGEIVDTTGAGDAFNAALAVALAEGKNLLDAVRYANCAGALACTKLGVIPALARREQVDELFSSR